MSWEIIILRPAFMKNNIVYICDSCGADYSKWQGKCDSCNEWNTIKELRISNQPLSSQGSKSINEIQPQTINQIKLTSTIRFKSGIKEVDFVIGGGIIKGEVILLAGNPGIGKSTLVLQIFSNIKNSLYISAEESLEQIKIRWQRLKLKNNHNQFLSTDNLDEALLAIEKTKPSLVIIDSIQAVSDQSLSNTAGSPVQVKICALKLQRLAKQLQIPMVLTSHVTKSGIVAGPKTLEHLVDAVFYLEGENLNMYRILRSVKNRYGSADEIGVFEMTEAGLKEMTNSENIFLDRKILGQSGVVATSILEGNRPLIVEIQCLAVKSYLSFPKRTSSGIDINRISLLIAVLEGTTKHKFYKYDLFFNLVSGLKTKEHAIDLAVVLSMVSALWKKPINSDCLAIGEVGLTGEIRPVNQIEKRVEQAKKLGFKKFIVPYNFKKKNDKIIRVKNIKSAIIEAFK